MSVMWYIHGLETDKYAQELISAVKATGNEQIHLKLPPFSTELPEPVDGPKVLYGGTRLVEAASKDPRWKDAVWYDAEKSRWSENYARWQKWFLMQHPILTTFKDVQFLPKDKFVFVRPDYDLKEFAGEIMAMSTLVNWRNRLFDITGEPGLTMDVNTPIIIGDVIKIAREWRLFIVNGEIIDCSRYRSNGILDAVRENPEPLFTIVNYIIKEYTLAPVFVLDMGATPLGIHGIIEANCFNSSGWYDVDLNLVVEAVSKYVESRDQV